MKEIFEKSTTEFADKTFVLETFAKKRGFEEITYGEFRNDVIEFGTGLEKALKIQPDEKIIIIGETTYEWYVSYMGAALWGGHCGSGRQGTSGERTGKSGKTLQSRCGYLLTKEKRYGKEGCLTLRKRALLH